MNRKNQIVHLQELSAAPPAEINKIEQNELKVWKADEQDRYNAETPLQRRDGVCAEAELGRRHAGIWLETAVRGVKFTRSPEELR
ncbi:MULTISPECIES: hypothetical protein [Bradyrhizobium]|uniref:hypothetical protein n=1 Tax=Bradyrhizobium TaxID=374 RepID=UPI00115FCC33|nr:MULTISPECIES: hypothetical protein [Bradyrhizobium]